MNGTAEILRSATLLFVLLNPFLVILYLMDLVQKLDRHAFNLVLLRAAVIATVVFCLFALLGDVIFRSVIRAEFASFQIFGGLAFLVIGLQFVFRGTAALEFLRGDAAHVSGAIAMPVLIGPGTISASVLIGNRLSPLVSCLVVAAAVLSSILVILVLKRIHDKVRPKREALVQRYIEITGRIMALYVGTIAVDMIMRGVRSWALKF